MSAKPWFKFCPDNWRSDAALRLCSMGARGLWVEMLCLMDAAEPRGHLLVKGVRPSVKQIASLAGCDPQECLGYLRELEEHEVFTRLRNGVITSRKMLRDARISAQQSARRLKQQPPETPKESARGGTGSPPKKLEARTKSKKPRGEKKPTPRKPLRPIPDGFPDEAALEKARATIAQSGARVNAEREAAKFRAYCESHDSRYRDYPATFNNWIIRQIGWALEDAGQTNVVDLPPPDPALARRRWETWIADWRGAPGQWKEHERGPPPGQAGCRIPTDVLAEFGYEPGRLAL